MPIAERRKIRPIRFGSAMENSSTLELTVKIAMAIHAPRPALVTAKVPARMAMSTSGNSRPGIYGAACR